MPADNSIVLIGCGKMGSALLQGWVNHKINANFSVIDPHDIPFPNLDHFRDTAEATNTLKTASAIILAIKPQIMDSICPALAEHISSDTLILSIAAGQSLTTLQQHFDDKQPIIRTMPNTPAAIGKGMSVAVSNSFASSTQKSLTQTLLESAGKFEWLDDETLMDAVTAVSGSGPAYLFYLIEALTTAAEKSGLSSDIAETLARQTVIGAAALAESEPAANAATLRQNVTSPGGTTEAALNILMNGKMQDLLNEAVEAAVKRGKELG